MSIDFRRMGREAARVAADKKAESIALLDIRESSDVADFILVIGAGSTAHLRAIHDAVEDRLAELGIKPLREDGRVTGRWMAVDFGGLVVHVLLPEARQLYRLEQMWENQKQVSWEKKKESAPKKKTARKKS